MPNVGPLELVIVLIIALVVLGPKKLPEVGRSIGRGMREFKGALSGDRDHDEPAESDHLDHGAGHDDDDDERAQKDEAGEASSREDVPARRG